MFSEPGCSQALPSPAVGLAGHAHFGPVVRAHRLPSEAGSGAASRGAHHADEACDQALPPCCSSCALSATERTVRALAKCSAGVAVAPVYALLCTMVHAK